MLPDYLYGSVSSPTVLRQGDIILLDGNLKNNFDSYFPGIIKPDQKRFGMILSQCCDLFKGEGRSCKVDHINICVLSSFERYLSRVIDSFAKKKNGFTLITENQYEGLSQKLIKLIKNSDPKNYFFLPNTQFFESHMIAVLSVNYPLRNDHYEDLLENRVGTLSDQFRNKLGFTMGKLYSRIATDDLSGYEYTLTEFIELELKKIKTTRIQCDKLVDEILSIDDDTATIDDLLQRAVEKQLKDERRKNKKKITSFLNSYIFVHYPEIAKLFSEKLDDCNGSEFRKKINNYLKDNITEKDIQKLFPDK
ncbi:hypothetical protein [Legionella maioricensis]|uniref:Uncharacterized protein n=1 Tax=Legionella maioricensis TaxID=2896528 RepID=A0A9X2D0E6_9GAMM|nr:hypothetical protein [Legionella maioricensis]MCL9684204.1 hypothetical protein [Legionella maioricensis]MCL9687070.1 hypothetical protein [Legionella maioricensis]